jgi:hypothetical protein
MTLKRLIQAILVIWFLAINVAILVPSYGLLFGAGGDPAAPPRPLPTPTPPGPPAIGPLDPKLDAEAQKQQVATYKHQVASYVEQVRSYTQQVSAYKVQTEAQSKGGRTAVYEVVVKNTLVTLLGGFATALIGVVFANLGAGVVDNLVRVKNNSPPQRLTLL